MAKDYVEHRDGGYFIQGTRVSLDSVVHAFLRGESPEGIAESFPALGFEQISGALTFYTANREVIDRYLNEGSREFETMRQEGRQRNPALYAKLAEARERSRTSSRWGRASKQTQISTIRSYVAYVGENRLLIS
jgi:uncharacterized protein (DUF433 family)